MTASMSGVPADAESVPRTAQSQTGSHPQQQFARSAADSAAEVAVDDDASVRPRQRVRHERNETNIAI